MSMEIILKSTAEPERLEFENYQFKITDSETGQLGDPSWIF